MIAKVLFLLAISCLSSCIASKQMMIGQETVTIQSLKIHIVPGHTFFPEGAKNYGTKGAALNGEIWVIGEMQRGRIVIDWTPLGHELHHVMSEQKPGVFTHPDLQQRGR